jgi:hypothetical protein
MAILANVVGFVKHDNRILRHLLGDLFRNFWVKEIMERVNDNINESKLRKSMTQPTELERKYSLPSVVQ